MIIYAQSLVASAVAAATPLTYPRIGWSNHIRARVPTDVSVSTENATGPKDAPLRPDTAEYWLPTALPATWTVDLGSSKTVDFVGIAGHTLGSSGAAVKVLFSSDGAFPDPYIDLPNNAGNYASTPDNAAYEIAGDLDLRFRADAAWPPTAETMVISKGQAAPNLAYRVTFNTGGAGLLRFVSSADGTAATIDKTQDFSSVFIAGTAIWGRVVHDVDNGAAGNDVKFYKSTDYNPATGTGIWTQVGATQTTAGVHTRYIAGAGTLNAGHNGASHAFKLFYAEVRNGIVGPVVSEMDPSRAEDGSTSWVSSIGEPWTLNRSGGAPQALLVNSVFAFAYLPADDAPLMFLDESRSGRYLRLVITGGAIMPKIGVVYAGPTLVMQKMVAGGYKPISMARDTILSQSLSRGGQFLGQSFRRNGVSGSAAFKNLTADWVRVNLDPFSKAARQYPYFFAWNPSQFPAEVGYVWTDKDIVPQYSGLMDLMDVSWNMKGVGTA